MTRRRAEIIPDKKVKTNDLGLVPKFTSRENDLGLSSADIQATSRVLYALFRHDHPLAPILTGEVKPDLEEQLGIALDREATATRTIVQRKWSQIRRNVLSVLPAALFTIGVFGFAGYLTYQERTPEAIAAQAKVAAEKVEQDRLAKVEFEKNNALGLATSTVSYNGWRINYPRLDENVDYVEAGQRGDIFTLGNNYWVYFPKHDANGSSITTNIFVSEYTRLDGTRIPELTVRVTDYRSQDESWLLQGSDDPNIDTRVVQFENPASKEIRYAAISRTKAQLPTFEVKMMVKTTKNK